jgi:hypothetical protein
LKPIGLHTADKDEAAAKARDFYLDLRANGWEIALARRKGAPVEKCVNVTIGEYIEAVAAMSLFSPKTLQTYAQALRKIVGDIIGETKREQRDAIQLRTLMPERIEAWRIEFIRRKATDPLREKKRPNFGEQLHLAGAYALQRRNGCADRDIMEVPSRYRSAASKLRRYPRRATGAPSTWQNCSKAPERSWHSRIPSKTRSASSERWRACGATKSIRSPGLRFAGMKA